MCLYRQHPMLNYCLTLLFNTYLALQFILLRLTRANLTCYTDISEIDCTQRSCYLHINQAFMPRLLISSLVITSVVATLVATSGAFFTDSEVSSGNVLGTANFDLIVDDNTEGPLPELVSLNNLLPGDTQTIYYPLEINSIPAKVYLKISNLTRHGGALAPAEAAEQQQTWGYEKADLDNYLDHTLTLDAQEIIPSGSGTLQEHTECWIPLGQIQPDTAYNIAQSYYLQPTVTNWAQGDYLNFDIDFLALQTNDPTVPVAESGRVFNPSTGKCEASPLTAGNDPIERSVTDTYSNFSVVDTNNSIASASALTAFSYYAANTNPFRILLVDNDNGVKWMSELITPTGTGEKYFVPNQLVLANGGDHLGLYFTGTGTVPFDYTGTPARYTANSTGQPSVGSDLSIAGTSGRTYSIQATNN